MHTYLPGVDDGAHDWDEAMALLKTGIWAGNPAHHSHTAFYRRSGNRDAIKSYVHASGLQKGRRHIKRLSSVSLGQEVRYFENLIGVSESGERPLRWLSSRYVLVEFGPSDSLGRMKRAVRQLIQASYFPVIAHVERYKCLLEKEGGQKSVVDYGAYLQINSRSLKG